MNKKWLGSLSFGLLIGLESILLYWLNAKLGMASILMLITITFFTGWSITLKCPYSHVDEVRQQVVKGKLNVYQALDHILFLVSGMLLIFPGVITDVTGILLYVKPIRAAMVRYQVRQGQAHLKKMDSTPPSDT